MESVSEAAKQAQEMAKDALAQAEQVGAQALEQASQATEQARSEYLRPALHEAVVAWRGVQGRADAVADFAQGSLADSTTFVRTSVVQPGIGYSIEHPEVLMAGTATLGAAVRLRRGPFKMIKGGIMGGVAGLGMLFFALGN